MPIFDPLVIQTFGRLAGIRAFLEELDHAVPESEWANNEALRQKAEEEDWDFGKFDVESGILKERFRFWLPRFTAYSVVTLLYTVVETQLAACANVARSQKEVSFQLADVRGRGVDAAALYLEKVGAYEARQDSAWQIICDLRDLRNLIVHRAGTKGESDEHRKTAQRLTQKYSTLVFPDRDWLYGEVWISNSLCLDFIVTVEEYFDRVFEALGLPPRYEARIRKRG